MKYVRYLVLSIAVVWLASHGYETFAHPGTGGCKQTNEGDTSITAGCVRSLNADTVGTAAIDIDADTPVAGEAIIVDTGATDFVSAFPAVGHGDPNGNAFGVQALSGFCLGTRGWLTCDSTWLTASFAILDTNSTIVSNTCCAFMTGFDSGDAIDICVAVGDGHSSDSPTSVSGTCVNFNSADTMSAFVCKRTEAFATITQTDYQLTLKADNIVDTIAGSEQIYAACQVEYLIH